MQGASASFYGASRIESWHRLCICTQAMLYLKEGPAMNVQPGGNPLLRAAGITGLEPKQAVLESKQSAARSEETAQKTQGPETPKGPSTLEAPIPQQEGAEPAPTRSQDDLERLADDVLAIFDDSPERLEELVATLQRLETKG